MEADDSSSASFSVIGDTVKEIRSFQTFCQTQDLTVTPKFVRQASSPRLLYSIQKTNFRSSPYSQLITLSQDPESSVGTSQAYFRRQMSETHEFSTGYLDFLGKTTDAMYSSVWIKLCMWLLAPLLLAVFLIGNHYVNDCPEIRELPYYLSIAGAAGFLKIVLIFLRRRDLARTAQDTKTVHVATDIVLKRYVRYTDNLLTLFLPVWSVLGNVWFFSKPTPNFTPLIYEPTKWCDEVLYDWVFYKLVFTYVFVSFMFIYVVLLTITYYSLGVPVLLKNGFIY